MAQIGTLDVVIEVDASRAFAALHEVGWRAGRIPLNRWSRRVQPIPFPRLRPFRWLPDC